jgi:hypothetical protein
MKHLLILCLVAWLLFPTDMAQVEETIIRPVNNTGTDSCFLYIKALQGIMESIFSMVSDCAIHKLKRTI